MSRSKRKPIFKDKGWRNKKYNRYIRRVQKQYWKLGKYPPNPKTIVNDWDYCDYKFDYHYKLPKYWSLEDHLYFKIKFSRK